jgi:hypothetical protein
MSVFYELPDQLFKELSEFYIKFKNVKQSDSGDNQLPNSQDQYQDKNKFELLFKQIEKIISNVVDDTLKDKPYFCSGYQTRYGQFFQKEIDIIEQKKTNNVIQIFELKKQLLAYMIDVVKKINPDQLPTYGKIVSAEACGIGYQPVLVQYLDKIKEKIKNNAIPLIFLGIKDAAKEEIKTEIDKVEDIISVLDGEKKSEDINTNDIKDYITDILDIPKNEVIFPDDVTSEYIVNELTKKYSDFLNINTDHFNKEIKKKIKRSIVEIVLIESKLKKIYNPKKSLLFSKAITEFFEK